MERELTLIGAGAAAAVLACELSYADVPTRIWARKPEAARDLAWRFGETCRAEEDLAAALEGANAVVFCVTDDALAEVAERVASFAALPRVALHLSGYHDASILAPLSARGVSCGSLHPVRPLATGELAPGSLRGSSFAFEGVLEAREVAADIAALCGAVLFDLPMRDGAKHAYHAAAALLSNGLVALYDTALGLAGRNDEVARAFLGLLEGTVDNLERLGVPGALTGPALRGDEEVLAGHLEQLDSEQLALYGSLTKRMLELALQRNALTQEQVQHLRELL